MKNASSTLFWRHALKFPEASPFIGISTEEITKNVNSTKPELKRASINNTLDRARLKYISVSMGIVLDGIVHAGGYLCGCSFRNLSQMPSVYEYEQLLHLAFWNSGWSYEKRCWYTNKLGILSGLGSFDMRLCSAASLWRSYGKVEAEKKYNIKPPSFPNFVRPNSVMQRKRTVDGGICFASSPYKSNYKSSTFAFVQFAEEESRKKAIQFVNGKWFDGKRISVGVAKYQKDKRREEDMGKRMVEFKSGGKDISKTGRKSESCRSMRDGRSYKDVVNSKCYLRRELESGVNLEGVKKNAPAVRNIWEMHIPSHNSDWVKRSLTGIMKPSFDFVSLKEALEMEGVEVRIARWGYVWNACNITFNSVEEFSHVWRNKKNELLLCLDWLAPVLNKDGVPMALCQIELYGLPLLCWNESFMKKLSGKWGDFICFKEESVTRSDLSSAKVLLRVESPYDVPETVTIGSYGRSFKVKISMGSVLKKPEEAGRKTVEKISKKWNSGYVLSREGVGRCPSLEADGDEFSADGTFKVISWLNNGQNSGVNGICGGQVPSGKSTADNSNCGLSGFLENRTNQMGSHVGLGLKDSNDQVDFGQSKDNEIAVSPIKKLIPNGPAYNIKWENTQGEMEVVPSEQGVELEKVQSAGQRSLDGDHMKKVMEDKQCSHNEGSVSSSSIRIRNYENQEGSTSKLMRVGQIMAKEDHPVPVNNHVKVYRRVVRRMVRDSMDQDRESSQSSQPYVKARNEAVATREICDLLGITFKGGQHLLEENIFKMEMKGSSRGV
ncbi:hypothetical protein F3Y22_tig00117056pilonHSYRG01388 [Hibiscus syriacus]|uniref:RRM domain-containing protein n=1 Tax=Hibiscus syriacus TaxID=106335 RepID=A0A6A2XKF6_HIBSY|nr:hypothetical protein F3Y22_tig00117056pilonHSYRG01388 [Hibiscus syriacus]